MKADLQRRIQRYGWDRAAAYYEPYWKAQLAPAQQRLLDGVALRTGEHALDVACGTGLVTFPAADRVGPSGRVFATDLSEQMVDFVQAEAARRGFRHVGARQMDAEELDVPEAAFDVVLCALGLMYVPDPLRAVREMQRILRAGGRAAVAVWGRRDRCGWAGIFPVVDARVNTDVCPLFFQLGTGDSLEMVFQAAGFESVAVERLSTTLHYVSAEEACGAAFAGGPVALAYSRFDASTLRRRPKRTQSTSIRLRRIGTARPTAFRASSSSHGGISHRATCAPLRGPAWRSPR